MRLICHIISVKSSPMLVEIDLYPVLVRGCIGTFENVTVTILKGRLKRYSV